MKKILFILLLIAFGIQSTPAQQKKLTIRDAVIGQYQGLYPDYIKYLRWRGNTDKFTFIEDDVLKQSGTDSKDKKEILSYETLNTELKDNGLNEISNFPGYTWINENLIRFEIQNHLLVYNMITKKFETVIKYGDQADKKYAHIEGITDFCEKNNKIAYCIDNNLFITGDKQKTVQVTNDKEGVMNGQIVHRNEFGVNSGTFWSPEGTYLAFYRKDESMVTDYPLVDMTKRTSTLENTKYPMAGMKSHEVKLGIYNVSTGKTTLIKTGEPAEKYLTNIAWSPDEKSMYIAILNREQNHLKLNMYNVSDGSYEKTLFEEKNDRYVEPDHPVMFLKTKHDKFIWQSERDGYNHVYLYNMEGKLIKQLTKGEWVVTEVLGFDEAEENMFFIATKESPLETHIYKVNLSSLEISKLSSEEGSHSARLSGNGKYIIDYYSNIKVPQKYNLIDSDGKLIRNLITSGNPLKDYNISKAKIITLKSGDGVTDLYGRLIKPVDFDPDKKYPAIIYVYSGPHSQLVTNSWQANAQLWLYYMAQKGYVVLSVDNRGTQNRGFEFESVIHRNIGKYEVEDQMKGVEYLKNLDYVDDNRIGVHGWSYGGFMTISMMLRHNDDIKAGVAGGPVIDWKYYEIMYGERYMDTPQENPEGYKNSNLANYADRLKGKLLIIHGGMDDTVVPQHSLTFIRECIKNDILLDYFVYPTHQHNIRGPDRIHLMKKITQYFDDNL